jgi:UrcA family protein
MNATRFSIRIQVPALLAGIASAFLGLGATISQAADESAGNELRRTVVQYEDLNLTKPQGIQVLYQRIVSAAIEVCDNRDHRSLKAVAEDQHCKERSIARAVAGIDLPELTALHLAKTGRPIADVPQVAKR